MKSIDVHLDTSKVKELYKLLWQQLRQRGNKDESWRLGFHSDGKVEVWAGRFGYTSGDLSKMQAPSSALTEAIRGYLEDCEAKGKSPDWEEAIEYLEGWAIETFQA